MQVQEIDAKDINFTLTNENGEEINCDMLYEVVDQVLNKVYIAYTDYVKDENGKFRIIIAELINNSNNYSIIPIEDIDIRNAISNQLNEFLYNKN